MMKVTRRSLAIAVAIGTLGFIRIPMTFADPASVPAGDTSPGDAAQPGPHNTPRGDINLTMETDALPLEYKLNQWRAGRQVDPDHFVNNPSITSH